MSAIPTTPVTPAPVPLISLDATKAAIVAALVASLQGIVTGATEDLQTFATGIINDTTAAAMANDQDTLNQLKDQALLILEINRLRAAAGASYAVTKVLNTVLTVAVQVALAAIK